MNVDTFFHEKHILITGGLGFIGSNLATRLLELGADVTLIDALVPNQGGNLYNVVSIRDRVQIIIEDIKDKALMIPLVEKAGYLFNLAGEGSHLTKLEEIENDLQVNLVAQLSLLQICQKYNPGIKIVSAGTRQVYGRPKSLPVNEDHTLQPVDFNGVNKLAGEMYHVLFHRIFGLRTTSLRLTNTFGPGMRIKDGRLTFIGLWFRQLIEGKALEVFGDGTNLRVFNYIDDVVNAFLLSAFDPATDGQVFNLGSDEPIRLVDLAQLMVSINQKGSYHLVPFPEERKKIDIDSYNADYAKINSRLGWKPAVRLADGINSTLKYYRANLQHYLADEINPAN